METATSLVLVKTLIMEETATKWTKKEFKAYLLLYAAMANYIESADEKEFILSKIDQETYNKMHKQIDVDNDYQAIQKIRQGYSDCGYSGRDLEVLMKEVKDLLYSDGKFDELERNLMMWLNKILND